jgi:hypothetical protein
MSAWRVIPAAVAVGIGLAVAAAVVFPGSGGGRPVGLQSVALAAAQPGAGAQSVTALAVRASEPIRFGRDVRPILSDRCYLCHGPDRANQQAGLRLDSFDAATAKRKDGAAIVPFRPDQSLLVQRIIATSPGKVMPPPDSGKHAVSESERAILRQWIAEGANYEQHWSFVPPEQPAVPAVRDAAWARTPIDRFVQAPLEQAGIALGTEADRATLCRRVYLDLTGLPPSPEETASFLADERADAYEQLVDRLLTQDPYRARYAERMSVPWLDVARYADTCGIHQDNGRQMWLWRDWVLAAFRDNMPYDRFVVEQVAGDLLPGATVDQQVASGFNRAHVTSDEGGAIDAEYLLEYAADRTNTVGSAFLGLSTQCARCHDHKFDPLTQEDFYSLLAFFNSNEEPGIYSQTQDADRAYEPYIDVMTPDRRARAGELDAAVAAARAARDGVSDAERAAFAAFRDSLRTDGLRWADARVVTAASAGGATLVPQPDGSVLASGANPSDDEQVIVLRTEATGLRAVVLEAMADPSLAGGRLGRAPNGNAVLDALEVEAVSTADPARRTKVPLAWAWADAEQANDDFRAVNALRAGDGRVWALDGHQQPGGRVAIFVATEPFGFPGGTELHVRLVSRSPYAQHVIGRPRLRLAAVPDRLLAALPPATSSWYIAGPFPLSSGPEGYDGRFGPESAVRIDLAQRFGRQGEGTFAWRYAPGVVEGAPVNLAQGVGAEFVAREVWAAAPGALGLSLGSDDGLQVFVNGSLVHERRIDRSVAADQERVSVPLAAGPNLVVCKVVNTGGSGGFFHREDPRAGDLPRDAVALLMPDDSVRPETARAAMGAWRALHSPGYRDRADALAAAEKARADLSAGVPRTMVMRERAMPTETFVLRRGAYDQPDRNRRVERGIPKVLGALPPDAPRNRLGLAQWLVGAENPLTARVVVNRFWEQFFGRGIVGTVEDFGLQGEWPSHLELLDWLAVDFRGNGWDVRRLVRQLVTSSTYRQSSRVRAEIAALDPQDRLLAWYPRQRLAAEQIRDQALFVGGLLKERLGGPSVKPYQPEGLWQETSMPSSNTKAYEQGHGEDLWRRSLYTYWKRASPPPSMLVLDAPTREFCAVRRFATNTPLQALVLWNDPQLVEAARAAAERVLREPGDDRARVARLWLRTTGEVADDRTASELAGALEAERRRWGTGEGGADAAKLLAVGEHPLPADIPAPELASWTMLTNAILASDPAIVKD